MRWISALTLRTQLAGVTSGPGGRTRLVVVGVPILLAGAAVVASPVATSSAACIPAKSVTCSGQTIVVTSVYDGQGATLSGIGGGPGEGSAAVIEVANGGTVKNVTISSTTAGIACLQSCTLENIHWTSVGDYAAAALGGSGSVMTVRNSRVDSATDKAFQHNGSGKVVLQGVRLGSVGHAYASCGNCGNAGRSLVASDVTVQSARYDAFAVQSGDAAPQLSGVSVGSGRVCSWYRGNSSDGRSCG